MFSAFTVNSDAFTTLLNPKIVKIVLRHPNLCMNCIEIRNITIFFIVFKDLLFPNKNVFFQYEYHFNCLLLSPRAVCRYFIVRNKIYLSPIQGLFIVNKLEFPRFEFKVVTPISPWKFIYHWQIAWNLLNVVKRK